MNRRSVANFIGIMIGLAGLAFMGTRIRRDWHQITTTLHAARPGWLVAALLAGLASMTLLCVNWLSLLGKSGDPTTLRRGSGWFFVGQLGKYVPGGIWPVVGQAELAARSGVDRRNAYNATLASMVFALMGALSTAAVCGLVSPGHRRLLALALAAVVSFAIAAVSMTRSRDIIVRVAAKVTRGRAILPEGRSVAIFTARHVPVWIAFGAINICVVVAVHGRLSAGLAVDLLFASAVSWSAGLVVIGVPGGIGVRESVFVALMSAPLGAPLALSVALTSRFVTVAVDLLGALGASAISRLSLSSPTQLSREGIGVQSCPTSASES